MPRCRPTALLALLGVFAGVSYTCWFWFCLGQAGDPCLLIVVYSMCTLRDSTPSVELTPGDRIRPSSRSTYTLKREKQWEGTVVFLSSC